MNPEEIAKLLHEALDGFRFSFDAEAKTNGYDAALGRLNMAKRRARQALKTVDEWANSDDTTDGKHTMKLHIKPGALPVEDGDTHE